MKQLACLLMGVVAAVSIVVGATPAIAQDKGIDAKAVTAPMVPTAATLPATGKLIFENAKVIAIEFRFKPGFEAPSVARPERIVHVVKGGTFMRTFPDGKSDKLFRKTGDTYWLGVEPYSFKNVGKSDIVLHVVYIK